MIPKFRAWVKPGVLSNHPDGVVADAKPDFLGMECLVKRDDLKGKKCFTEIFDFEDIEFMQSTGLKDKNGVEIFEGDIVNYEDGEFSYIGSVKKDCYQFYINGIEPVDSYDFIDVSNTFDGTTSLTIIGNIYENLELLEARK
ncbi:YopX family protein [Enterococcus malodoratus]|uniref:YopX family protein n=1 Tax=Enterococcus malodoratus TaxID=71451 RepID=UPI0039AF3487